MAASSPRIDTFGTFLDALNKAEQRPNENASIPRDLFDYLLEAPEPVAVPDAMARVRLPVATFANAIETLKNAQLVNVTERGGLEYIGLTEIGKEVAKLKINIP